MKKKLCEVCGKEPIKRMTMIYHLPNEHIGFVQRFLRRHWRNLVAQKQYVCEDCYFEGHYGLFTIKCSKCNETFKVDIGDWYNHKKIYCCYCKKVT